MRACSVPATSDSWTCVCSSSASAVPPVLRSSLAPGSSEDRQAWSTGRAPPRSGRSPSSHSATSPSRLSASARRPGPWLRLSAGRSPGPAGSPSLRLGAGPAARHAGRSVSRRLGLHLAFWGNSLSRATRGMRRACAGCRFREGRTPGLVLKRSKASPRRLPQDL